MPQTFRREQIKLGKYKIHGIKIFHCLFSEQDNKNKVSGALSLHFPLLFFSSFVLCSSLENKFPEVVRTL